MKDLPDGVVILLFTDVQGSTRVDIDDYRAAIERGNAASVDVVLNTLAGRATGSQRTIDLTSES